MFGRSGKFGRFLNNSTEYPIDVLEAIHTKTIKIITGINSLPKYIMRYGDVREYAIDTEYA